MCPRRDLPEDHGRSDRPWIEQHLGENAAGRRKREEAPISIGCATKQSFSAAAEAKAAPIQVWSPYATAQFNIAQSFAGVETSANGPVAQPERMKISRTIVDDAEVLYSVVGELRRRGIDLYHDPTVHVALVTELDSSYGQALPLTFQAATLLSGVEKSGSYHHQGFEKWLKVLRDRPLVQPDEDVLQRIRIFRYLRGLDGIAFAPKTATDSDLPKRVFGTKLNEAIPKGPRVPVCST